MKILLELMQQMATAENYSKSGLTISSHHHIPHHHHHHIRRHRIPSGGGDDQEDEQLNPRIQVELEKLNRASEEINRLELELDDARAAFRQILSDSTQCLNSLVKKLGGCVDKARPYYDAKMKLQEAHLESQKAVLKFERSCSMHEAAKEMVQLAEEGYKRRERALDPTWQEMLNYATMKVNEAERERIESEEFHQKITLNCKYIEQELQKLEKDLRRAITKSRPYFDMKAKFNQLMEEQKRLVSRLEEDIGSAKALYSQALHSLEAISDSIHQQRFERRKKEQLGARGMGVGAEAPSPPPFWDKGVNIEGSATSYVYEGDTTDVREGHVTHITETVLGMSQLRLVDRCEGVTDVDPTFHIKTSAMDRNFKTDPPDVAVFENSAHDFQHLSGTSKASVNFQLPSVIHAQHDRARNSSYQAAIESSQMENLEWEESNTSVNTKEEYSIVTEAPSSILKQSAKFGQDVIQGLEVTSPRKDLLMTETQTQRHKMLILQQQKLVMPDSQNIASESCLPILSHTGHDSSTSATFDYAASQNSSLADSSDQPSPLLESPSNHRRAPKLQGLILQVDSAGLTPPSPSFIQELSGSVHSSVNHHADQKPTLVISTQHPILGVFIEKPPHSQPPVEQQLNKMNVDKISQPAAKMMPSALNTVNKFQISAQELLPSCKSTSPARNLPSSVPPLSTSSACQLNTEISTPGGRCYLSEQNDQTTSDNHKAALPKPESQVS